MSDASTPAQTPNKGRHYEFIKNATHDTFKSATLGRGLALAATPMKMQPWYTSAPASLHDKLKAANLKAWGSQNQVDKLFKNLQDVHSFAKPLLQAKLKERYGIEHDVSTTYLHLYLPKNLPWYTLDVSDAVTTRTVSLLDAALHNFAQSETVLADSQYITKPDTLGHFDVIALKDKMTISQFQAICRELDIGALYKEHLESYLLPGEAVAEAVMQLKVTESLKDALGVAAQLALTTGDIPYDAYKLIQNLAKDEPQLQLDGRHMRCCDLSLMETRLTGIVLWVPAVNDSRGIRRLIAYVPQDPEHPLKEYPSTDAFMTELTRQLREDKVDASSKQTYRQFFSQFVDQQQRGHFFADLDQRLVTVKWHEKEDPTDQQPTWREEPVSRPHLQFQPLPLAGDYWKHAYQRKLNKVLNDAREIAVSTANTDSNARWAWWDNFKKIVSDIFNVALLIATPFVPGLGELMMAYTVYQLTHDVIEGIVDLAEGLGLEAAEHVIGVVTDVIQLATFAAGVKVGDLFKLKLSPLIEGMKPVKLPNGKETLWHPDLAPYEQASFILPADSKPNEIGLHRSANQDILPLDDKVYVVEKASQEPSSTTHRIKHPTRPNAYSPTLEHNGHGAWVHEAENPGLWEGATLMRRLGHSVDRFSSTELEQIRISSGTEDNALRRMHVDNAPPPPVLADTIKRFSAYDDVEMASADIRAGRPLAPSSLWFESMTTALPGWPSERALKVFEQADLTGSSRQYGNANATHANTLNVSLADVVSGKLPEHVVGFLNETEVTTLLGREVASADRTQALRAQLADAVDRRKDEIANYLYQAGERSSAAPVSLLRETFADMPLTLTDTLLSDVKAAERQIMDDEHRLPLRIKTLAREMNFEAGSARAYEGFYRDEQMVPDTERLALNTLKFYSDSFADVRIEVRNGTYDGTLRCSVGPEDAATVRRLVRIEHGQYEVLDGDNKTLHAAGDFHEALLRALPEDKRAALGYQRGQGALLKLWIMEKSAPPAQRRTLLAEPPVRATANIETVTLLRGPALSKAAISPEERIRNLYPHMSEQEARTFVEVLRAKGDPDQAINLLRYDIRALEAKLAEWERIELGYVSADSGPGNNYVDYRRHGGRYIRDRLLECFERKSQAFGERSSHPDSGYTLDLSSDLMGPDLDHWWNKLLEIPDIKKYLDQVTVLNVDNARFSPDTNGLLKDFANVRHFSARYCNLTELPRGIGKMHLLETLRLSNNDITLTPESVKQLADLTRMETLRLDHNPLGQAPDVGRMRRLKVLSLNTTGLDTWPERLFKDGVTAKARPRGFDLDLRNSRITTVPDVIPGSDHAFLVARTRLDTAKLDAVDQLRFADYRQSVGMAPRQAYEPAATDEITYWRMLPDDSSIYSPTSGVGSYREESWHDVASEPNSADFFRVIRKQRESADYRHPDSRKQLTKRVWQMIDAMALDSDLREELFKRASDPETCSDAGSQLFNNMGMKVLVSHAHLESVSARELENSLVKLARSAARLEQIGDIARDEIKRQELRNQNDPAFAAPDDVEVHLAYETALGKRLDLPWQSESMRYEARADVSETAINAAYDKIIQNETADGLVDRMTDLVENPFWIEHLKRIYAQRFQTSQNRSQERLGLLEDLQQAQADWASLQDEALRNARRPALEILARSFNVDQLEVFSGEAMSTDVYNRLLVEISGEEKQLQRTLTRQAMANAGI